MALEMDEEYYRQEPGYDTRRSLSASYDRMGGICWDKDTPEGRKEAEEWFRKALLIDEKNHRLNPGAEMFRGPQSHPEKARQDFADEMDNTQKPLINP